MRNVIILLFVVIQLGQGISQTKLTMVFQNGFGYSKFIGDLNGKYVHYSHPLYSFGIGLKFKKKLMGEIYYSPEFGLKRTGYSFRINDFFFEAKTRATFASYRIYSGADFNYSFSERKNKSGRKKAYNVGIQPLISYQLNGIWSYDNDDSINLNTKYFNFDLGLNFNLRYKVKHRRKRDWAIGLNYYLGILPSTEDRGTNAYLREFNLSFDFQLKKK